MERARAAEKPLKLSKETSLDCDELLNRFAPSLRGVAEDRGGNGDATGVGECANVLGGDEERMTTAADDILGKQLTAR